MIEVNVKITEELYEFYRKIGETMDSSAEEVMEMMLRVCATHIKRRKEHESL